LDSLRREAQVLVPKIQTDTKQRRSFSYASKESNLILVRIRENKLFEDEVKGLGTQR